MVYSALKSTKSSRQVRRTSRTLTEEQSLEKVVAAAKKKRDELHLDRLISACSKGDLDRARAIFTEYGIDVNIGDHDRRRPIHLAACGGHIDLIEFLIDHTADVNVEDSRGGTALSDALRHGEEKAAEFLWAAGGRVGSSSKVGDLLSAAADKTDDEKLRLLCSFGTELNLCDHDGRTALHVAAAAGLVNKCKLLIENQAFINLRDRWGVTPLQDALLSDHDECGQVLLNHGAEIGEYDMPQKMCEAAANDDVAFLQRLIHFRGKVNMEDGLGRRPLHVAATNKMLSACNFLLCHEGIQINALDHFGNTALDDAQRAEAGSHPTVSSLIASFGGRPGARAARITTTKERVVLDDARTTKEAQAVAELTGMLDTSRSLVRWLSSQSSELHVFAMSVEAAITLEKERGPVLADEMPELWAEVRKFAKTQMEQRNYILETVYPTVKRWTRASKAQDIIGQTLRLLEMRVCTAMRHQAQCLRKGLTQRPLASQIGQLVDNHRAASENLERLAENSYRRPDSLDPEQKQALAANRRVRLSSVM